MRHKRSAQRRGAVSAIQKLCGFKTSEADQRTTYRKVCRTTFVVAVGDTGSLIHHLSRKHELEYQEWIMVVGFRLEMQAVEEHYEHTETHL